MKNTTHIRTHFIYEVDNIPDHRSRRFGCCPSVLAVSKAKKKPYPGGHPNTASAKGTVR